MRKKKSKSMNNMEMHCDNKNSSLKNIQEISVLSAWVYITHISPDKPKWSSNYHS